MFGKGEISKKEKADIRTLMKFVALYPVRKPRCLQRG
jgi:hypothetical protein